MFLNLSSWSQKLRAEPFSNWALPEGCGNDDESGRPVFWVLAQELQFPHYEQKQAFRSFPHHRHIRGLSGLRPRVRLRLEDDEGRGPRRSERQRSARAAAPARSVKAD